MNIWLSHCMTIPSLLELPQAPEVLFHDPQSLSELLSASPSPSAPALGPREFLSIAQAQSKALYTLPLAPQSLSEVHESLSKTPKIRSLP